MKLPQSRLCRALPLTLLLSALAGCVSTPSAPSGPANVFVSDAGIVTYLGASCAMDQLPRRLARSGIGANREIRIHLKDPRNQTQLCNQMVAVLTQNGYRYILFQSATRMLTETEEDSLPGLPPQRHVESLVVTNELHIRAESPNQK